MSILPLSVHVHTIFPYSLATRFDPTCVVGRYRLKRLPITLPFVHYCSHMTQVLETLILPATSLFKPPSRLPHLPCLVVAVANDAQGTPQGQTHTGLFVHPNDSNLARADSISVELDWWCRCRATQEGPEDLSALHRRYSSQSCLGNFDDFVSISAPLLLALSSPTAVPRVMQDSLVTCQPLAFGHTPANGPSSPTSNVEPSVPPAVTSDGTVLSTSAVSVKSRLGLLRRHPAALPGAHPVVLRYPSRPPRSQWANTQDDAVYAMLVGDPEDGCALELMPQRTRAAPFRVRTCRVVRAKGWRKEAEQESAQIEKELTVKRECGVARETY
ncbi:hypothetical protein EDB86DRAFT_3078521 [Lactarius hatsudake]|nr:hypothetical protein EDB86DRAFT_3078521 [Lactarius hatsudake]